MSSCPFELGLGQLQILRGLPGIQADEDLSGFHPIPFVDEDLLNSSLYTCANAELPRGEDAKLAAGLVGIGKEHHEQQGGNQAEPDDPGQGRPSVVPTSANAVPVTST